MNRDQLADWLHCLEGGMYDWVQEEIQKELNKPNQFYPDWDMLKPFHDRIAELEIKLAKPWVGLTEEEMLKTLIEIDSKTVRLPIGFKLFADALSAKLQERNT
jgi:hypothetical protein